MYWEGNLKGFLYKMFEQRNSLFFVCFRSTTRANTTDIQTEFEHNNDVYLNRAFVRLAFGTKLFVYMVHDCIWHGQLLLSLKLLTTFVLNTHFYYCSNNVLTLESTITKCNIHVDLCVSSIEFASWKDFFYCFNVMFG